MALPETGLFNNRDVMSQYQALRATTDVRVGECIGRIERAGPIMVVDPEKAATDLTNTLERIKIAAQMGMSVIEIGGSTDNGEAEDVVPAIRETVDGVSAQTLLVGFPGTGRQVIKGLDAVYSLFMPQLDPVFKTNPGLAAYFIQQYFEVIKRGNTLGIPVLPVAYILFNGGAPTTVERITGINAIPVGERVDVQEIMGILSPWLREGDLAKLELGSGPFRFANLGPVAAAVFENTGVRPIVTGGISSPDRMASVLQYTNGYGPVVFGSVAEQTPPEQFGALYQSFRNVHPICKCFTPPRC